jgi:hypothetical protein
MPSRIESTLQTALAVLSRKPSTLDLAQGLEGLEVEEKHALIALLAAETMSPGWASIVLDALDSAQRYAR